MIDLTKEYGVFKTLCSNNCYNSLAKTLSSELSTRATLPTIKRLTNKNMKYGHMGQLVIKDGICYSTFIQNTGDDGEQPYSETSEVVLAIFDVDRATSEDFVPENDVNVIRLGGKGDSFAGFKATSIFKDNSMCLCGDDIYITFTFECEDGKAHMFSVRYNIPTGELLDDCFVKLIYNGEEYDFTDATLNLIYRDKGLAENALSLIELVSHWSEYKGEYYGTGITIGKASNGFIVKTADFKTMTLVDAVPFNNDGMAEIASYIKGDKLFVACRQDYGIPYLLLSFYDLKENKWSDYYRFPDGNVRPWFFEWKGELYLLNTVDEFVRRYTNISKVTTNFYLYNRTPVETVATLKDCGSYMAIAEHDGRLFYVCSKDTVSFGEMKLILKNDEEVNGRLAELFS